MGSIYIDISIYIVIYRVTDEALIAETMVWPNFFLMNVFFALKGSKLLIIIFLLLFLIASTSGQYLYFTCKP